MRSSIKKGDSVNQSTHTQAGEHRIFSEQMVDPEHRACPTQNLHSAMKRVHGFMMLMR